MISNVDILAPLGMSAAVAILFALFVVTDDIGQGDDEHPDEICDAGDHHWHTDETHIVERCSTCKRRRKRRDRRGR